MVFLFFLVASAAVFGTWNAVLRWRSAKHRLVPADLAGALQFSDSAVAFNGAWRKPPLDLANYPYGLIVIDTEVVAMGFRSAMERGAVVRRSDTVKVNAARCYNPAELVQQRIVFELINGERVRRFIGRGDSILGALAERGWPVEL